MLLEIADLVRSWQPSSVQGRRFIEALTTRTRILGTLADKVGDSWAPTGQGLDFPGSSAEVDLHHRDAAKLLAAHEAHLAASLPVAERHRLAVNKQHLAEVVGDVASVLANKFAEAEGLSKSSLFALGLILLCITFAIQIFAQLWLNRIRKNAGGGL